MAGTPLAEAFVRVRALTDKFKDDIRDAFNGVGDDFGRQFGKEASARLRAERDAFEAEGRALGEQAGDAAGDAFGEHMAEHGAVQFGDDASPYVEAGKRIGGESGDAAGREFGDHMEEGAVRFGDDGAPYVRVGKKVGDKSGEAAGKQFADRMEAGAVRFGDDGAPFVEVGKKIGKGSGGAAGDSFNEEFDRKTREGGGRDRGRRQGKEFGDGFGDGLGDGLRKVGEVGRTALESLLPSLGKLASGFGSVFASVGKWTAITAGIAALGAAAADAAVYTLELSAAIAPVGGLLAGLPGIALVGAAAFTTWKLATSGLGEAMKQGLAGNDEKYAEALAKLTASGQLFVREVVAAGPALDAFKAAAQGAFTDQLAGSVAGWVAALGGLKPAIAGLASELGGIVRAVLDFATSAQSIGQFNSIFGSTRDLVAAVKDALQPLLKGFTDLGVVGASWLGGFAGPLRDVLTTFGEWMSRISESGQALAWLNDATVVLKQLGALVKDVWGIFTGLLKAAETAGAGALGVLGALVDTFNTWVNSTEGQDVLVTVFRALDEVGRALLPVITALGGAVAAIAPQAAAVATALGPVLASAISALGPAIAAVGPGVVALIGGIGAAVQSLGPALIPLGAALAAAFTKIAPLIAALGPAIAALLPGAAAFLGALSSGLAAVTPLLEPLGRELGGILGQLGGALALIIPQVAQIALALAPALAAAVTALGPALAALGPGLIAVATMLANAFADPAMQAGLLAIGKGLSDLLIAAAPLLPIVGELAGIIAQVLGAAVSNLGTALGPIIVALASALQPALAAISSALTILAPLMPPIYEAFGRIAAAVLTEVLPPILDLIPAMINSLIPAFAELARQVAPLLPVLTDLAVALIEQILPAVLPMLPKLTELGLEFAKIGIVVAGLVADLAPFIEQIIAIFQHLYDVLVGHSIIPDMITAIRDWFQRGVDWVKSIISWFGDLPGLIGGWLQDAVSRVQAAWDAIRNAVADRVGAVQQAVTGALSTISAVWGQAWGNALSVVSSAWGNIRNAAASGASNLLGVVSGIPGQIVGALGNLGGLLYNAGASIIQGLINGLYSKLQDAYNSAADILNRIRSLFPFSPAKEGPFSGKGWTTYSGQSLIQGLAEGALKEQGTLTAALDQVMRAGADALTPALPAFAGPSPAPGFDGSFGSATSAGGGGAVTGSRTFVIENLNVQGVFDPSSPVSYRRMVERLREAIRELEKEEYANG